MTWHGGLTIVGKGLEVERIESLLGVTGQLKTTRSGEQVWHWEGAASVGEVNAILAAILETVRPVAMQLSKLTSESALRAWVSIGWDDEEAPEVVLEPNHLAVCAAANLRLSLDFPLWRN